jgi:Short C-terminal domain
MRSAMVGGTAWYTGRRRREPGERAALTSEALAQLEQLAALRERGVLSDEELEAQKRRVLGAG